ncbi:MAG: 4-hydroxythreonine-4-phosphate dehydrogenase PdxA [Comamonadaceae bacterium]|nr:4-hydroxythreonine-4-phosphate dehydrogenase PdxA [Comamonadaceae bacterium]
MNGLANIAISVGDPNGIGPEIALKSAERLALGNRARPLIVGSRIVVDFYASALGIRTAWQDLSELSKRRRKNLEIDCVHVDCFHSTDFSPGVCSAASGRACIRYLEAAVRLQQIGTARATVAAPHNETAIRAAGIEFSGYPSYLQKMLGDESEVFLLLVSDKTRVCHVTLHLSLREALERVTKSRVEACLIVADEAIRKMGVEAPRLGVAGLNPHASEGGLFGSEESNIIVPAIERARDRGIDVVGPLGADMLFSTREEFDVIIVMFHDQGHAPMKALYGRNTIALSVGAGLTFASVGHGSAPDIAGDLTADPVPLYRACCGVLGVDI